MPHLFEPFTLRGVTLRNRIGVSPMCQYSSENGRATDWHLVHLGSRAVGGAGLVIVEASAVEARGRISPQDAGLWSDDQIGPLSRITRFIAQHGAVPGIQLAHAGRKASTFRPWEKTANQSVPDEEGGWQSLGPSPVPFKPDQRIPVELTREQIREIRGSFEAATLRSVKAGFEWLELHAAHGYLCHSFHSPVSNFRTDEYGGSFDNRVRFTLETAECVRRHWPQDKPMSVRLSCTDWYEGGWTLEESIELAKRLKEIGIDLIDCSSGAGTPLAKIPFGPSFQVPFADAIRHGAGIPTAAVGFVMEAMQADEVVRNERADIVLLGRELLRDPYWPVRAARTLGHRDKLKLPDQYEYAVGNRI
jgi:2,4-dienoyl-CoA reductase-like NADH-dependent reductase (Old Yellow Enzyme family)